MKRLGLIGVFSAVAFSFLAAHSEAAYKCVDANGKVNFQDKKCPTTSTESEIALKKESKSTSSQVDQSWSNDRKQILKLMCIRGLGQLGREQSPNAELAKEICDCTAKKYYANPKPVLDEIEKTGDTEKAKKLMEPAMISCAKETLESSP